MSRQPEEDITPKQLEVFELILNHVRQNGYQPNLVELGELLGVAQPAVKGRIDHLIAKGLLKPLGRKSERCWGFVGLKFLPFQVDPETGEIAEEQTIDLGDWVATIKRRK